MGDLLAAFDLLQLFGDVVDAANLPAGAADGIIERSFQPVPLLQREDPARQIDLDLLDREFHQDVGEDLADIRLGHIQAVDRQHRHAVALLHLFGQLLRLGAAGALAVEQHGKRLLQLLQFADDPLLGLGVLLAGDVADRAVGGHHQPDGGVLLDDLLGADLGGHVEGDLLLKPGGHHHARLLVFDIAQ